MANYDFGNDVILGHMGHGPGRRTPLVLSREARAMHTYIVGSTGSGKTKLLESIARQDILNWSRTQCGMALVDLHGSLFKGVMDWVAATDLQYVPIVPIDMTQNGWIIAYNPLRPRPEAEAQTAVIVSGFVRGIAHAWGAADMQSTPLLHRWLHTILASLYGEKLTLGDSLRLIRSPDFRNEIAARVQDPVARCVWDISRSLKEAELQEQLSSTVNRIVKFLSSQIMRATLCQTGLSLDLSAAIREGSILLISLATEGGHIDEEDAATFAAIFLSDLWTAAKSRGKHETGPAELVKPFYLMLDEFQQFMTPVMADTLDQARGFGLHLTLAHQYPTQLLDRGVNGQRVFNSVMANARTKIVFQLDHPEDLPILAGWLFRNEINPDAVKFRPYSTKVMGHELRYVQGQSQSRTRGTSMGTNWSDTDSTSRSDGTNWAEAESHGSSDGYNVGLSDGSSDTHTTGASDSRGKTSGRNRQHTAQRSRGLSRGRSASNGFSETAGTHQDTNRTVGVGRSLGEPAYGLKKNLEEEEEEYHDLVDVEGIDEDDTELRKDRLDRATRRVSINESRGQNGGTSSSIARSHSDGQNESESLQEGESDGWGESDGDSQSHTDNSSRARGTSRSRSMGHNHADTASTTNTTGGSETFTEGQAHMAGGSESSSESFTQGTSNVPMLYPILGREAGTPVFRTIDEQLYRKTQQLAGQKNRQCTVRMMGQSKTIAMTTLTVAPMEAVDWWKQDWLTSAYQRIGFAVPLADAIQRLNERDQASAQSPDDEPATFRRKLP